MKPKRICIIHLNQIGDLVFSLPLLRALRKSYPDATIHSIIRPHLQELLMQSPFVDGIIEKKRGLRNVLTLLKSIRDNRYDLLISLSHSQESLLLAGFSGAGLKAGFSSFPWDLGLDIKEKIEGHHSCVNNLRLLERLGVNVEKKDYVGLLILPSGENKGESDAPPIPEANGKYVVISPGTSAKRTVKAWGEEKFADLMILLKERYGLSPVIVGGKDNRDVSEKIIGVLRRKDVEEKIKEIANLTGKMGLTDLCRVLRGANLFVGVDSGVMHLASSFDIPVVGIFGPTDPFYVGPLGRRSKVVREELECSPCYLKGCKKRICMEKLEVAKVFDACEQVLRT